MFDRSRKNQKVRVPEYTLSLLPLSLVHFGFCTNLVGFLFSSLNKLFARTDRVKGLGLDFFNKTVFRFRGDKGEGFWVKGFG